MKELTQLQALAKLDGFIPTGCNPELFVCDREVLKYLHSLDAIVPLVQKWVESHGDIESQLNASTKFNYALTDTLHRANVHEAEYYGWTYVQTILSKPPQLCEALLRASGNWSEE